MARRRGIPALKVMCLIISPFLLILLPSRPAAAVPLPGSGGDDRIAAADGNVFAILRVDFFSFDEPERALDRPKHYELLLDEPTLGALRTKAFVKNLSTEPMTDFTARLRVKSAATAATLFNAEICVDSSGLARAAHSGLRYVDDQGRSLPFPGPEGLAALPPGGIVSIDFDFFALDPDDIRSTGLLELIVDIPPFDCKGVAREESELDDNSFREELLGVTRLLALNEDGSDFLRLNGQLHIPSQGRWINRGAEVVDGGAHCYQPPGPQLISRAANDEEAALFAPLIRMNRIGGPTEPERPAGGGDTLTSFPLDLSGVENAVLTFSVQRTGRVEGLDEFNTGWSDRLRIGPEARVIEHGDPEKEVQRGDRLIVEFASPFAEHNPTGVNVPESAWNLHPVPDRLWYIQDNRAYTLFGAGGHRQGFNGFHNGGNSQAPDVPLTFEEGLRLDLFDAGNDREFFKVAIPIPEAYLVAEGEEARNFRFRIRVEARDDGVPGVPDDNDDFFIDNIAIVEMTATETPDIEVVSLGVDYAPSVVNRVASGKVPSFVTIANNSTFPSRAFRVLLTAYNEGDTCFNTNNSDHYPMPSESCLYRRLQTLPFLRPGVQLRIPFPTMRLRRHFDSAWISRINSQHFVIRAQINVPGGDPISANDEIMADVTVHAGDLLAYDYPSLDGRNDVAAISGIVGKGLNLPGASVGDGSQTFGAETGGRNAEFAIRISLPIRDTIAAYHAYFGSRNRLPSQIVFQLYAQDANGMPGKVLEESVLPARRGLSNRGNAGPQFDQYSSYVLPQSLILEPGEYWLAIKQRESEPLELGGSAYRTGMVSTCVGPAGSDQARAFSTPIASSMKEFDFQGRLQHRQNFVYRNSGDRWRHFLPDEGNPAYAYHDAAGNVNDIPTYSRGIFLPMLRLAFDNFSTRIDTLSHVCGMQRLELYASQLQSVRIEQSVNLDYDLDPLSEGVDHVGLRLQLLDIHREGAVTVVISSIYGESSFQHIVPALERPVVKEIAKRLVAIESDSYQWLRDGVAIEGATNQTIAPLRNGVYSVKLRTAEGCLVESEAIEIDRSATIARFESCDDVTFSLSDKVFRRIEILERNNVEVDAGGFEDGDIVLNVQIRRQDREQDGNARLRIINTDNESLLEADFPAVKRPEITRRGDTLFASSAAGYQWFEDGIVVIASRGGTAAWLVPRRNAVYTVRTTDARGCPASSEPFVVSDVISELAPPERKFVLAFDLLPNPAGAAVKADFSLPSAGIVRLVLADLMGRQSQILFNGLLADGRHRLTIPLDNVSAGLYFCTIEGPYGLRGRRALLVR